MAMELQLNTGKAETSLKNVERAIESLRGSLERAGASGGSADALFGKLSAFKGLDPAATASVRTLSDALSRLSQLGTLSTVASNLNKLSQLNVSAAAAGVERLGTALANVRVPPNVSALTNSLLALGNAANRAASSLGSMNASMNAIRPPGNLATIASQFQTIGQNAAAASRSVNTFGSSLGSANTLLNAFGVALGAAGVANFVKSGYDMVNVFESFKSVVGATAGGTKVAADELAYIQETAKRLKIDIETTTAAYGKFISAQAQAGQEVGVSREQFTKLSEVFRVLNLSQDKTRLSFLAIEQMVSKGTVSMEELRRQLGENVPAFGILAKEMGITTGELSKLISEGKVLASEAIPLLVNGLHSTYVTTESLNNALKKPAATMTNLTNAAKTMSTAFYQAFDPAISSSVNALSDAMNSVPAQQLAAAFGQLAGTIVSVIATGVRLAIEAFTALASVIGNTPTALLLMAAGFLAIVGPITTAIRLIGLFSGVQMAMAAAPAILNAIGIAWRFIATGAAAAWAAMGPLGKIVTIVSAGLLAGAGALGLFSSSANAAEGQLSETENSVETMNADLQQQLKAALNASGGVSDLGGASSSTSGAQSGLAGSLSSTTSAMQSQTAAANQLAAALANVKSAGGGGGDMGPMIPGNSQTRLTDPSDYSYNLQTTENEYDGMTTLPVGTPSEYYETGGEFRLGGIVGKGAPSYAPVRSGLYNAAPKLATGTPNTNAYPATEPGGGIPAVVHPNEAVIPLGSGGTVPVNMGGGMNQLALYMKESVTVLKNLNQKEAITRESIIDVGVILKNEADRIYGCLQKMEALLFRIAEGINRLGTISSSSGGGGGGGSSSGGSSSVGPQPSGQNYGRGRTTSKFQGGTSGIGYIDDEGSVWAHGSGPWYENGNHSTRNGTGRRYATGSPNASRDAGGGFMAMLHPDEAVIPLPDGRSVPVDLGVDASVFQRLNKFLGGPGNGGIGHSTEVNGGPDGKGFGKNRDNGNGGGVRIEKLEVNIMSPDVRSFRESQDQIMQQFERDLRRSISRVGSTSAVDDPTRRPE